MRRRQYARAHRGGELYNRRANVAGSAADQHCLAGMYAAQVVNKAKKGRRRRCPRLRLPQRVGHLHFGERGFAYLILLSFESILTFRMDQKSEDGACALVPNL